MDAHRPSPTSTRPSRSGSKARAGDGAGGPQTGPPGRGEVAAAEGSPPTAEVEIGRRIQLGLVASDAETLQRGRRAFAQGEDDVALECLGRLAAHGLRYADVYYMLGMLKERQDELDAAIGHLQKAIRINPAYVEALLALASLYERRGDFDRSRGYAERASQLARPSHGGLDPTTRAKLANQQADLADALAAAGELREAIDEYRKALARCPTFHDIRHRLAITLREAGLPAQAAREFQQILRFHPGLLESQIQLGLTWYAIGRMPDALAEWNAVLEKDPSRDAARMYLRLMGGVRANASLRTTAARNPGHVDRPQREATAPRTPAGARADAAPEAEPAGWSTTELVRPSGEPPG